MPNRQISHSPKKTIFHQEMYIVSYVRFNTDVKINMELFTHFCNSHDPEK